VSLLSLFNIKIGYSMVSILTKLFLRKQLNFNEIIFEECRPLDKFKNMWYKILDRIKNIRYKIIDKGKIKR
jgi:hypothetical protein